MHGILSIIVIKYFFFLKLMDIIKRMNSTWLDIILKLSVDNLLTFFKIILKFEIGKFFMS